MVIAIIDEGRRLPIFILSGAHQPLGIEDPRALVQQRVGEERRVPCVPTE